MQGQYPQAKWMPNRHFWTGRSGKKVRYLVLHGTASPKLPTAEAVARYYQETSRDTSAHYIIGKDGAVVQTVAEEDTAWANGNMSAGHASWWGKDGNPNFETISIEHVHTNELNNDPMTEAQKQASFMLILYLVNKWHIAPRWADETGGVTGHFSIDPVGRWFCPGPYPWAELFAYLESPTNQPQTTAEDTDVSTGMRAHRLLVEVPGFLGLAGALDTGMNTEKLQDNSFGGVTSWIAHSGFALSTRTLVVLLGVLLLVVLLYALIRNNDWMGRAGYANVPSLVMRSGTQQ